MTVKFAGPNTVHALHNAPSCALTGTFHSFPNVLLVPDDWE